MNNWFYIVLFIILAIVLYVLYRRNFKILNVPSVCLITGGVKTGKSVLSVKLSQKDFKKRHFIWKIKRLFRSDLEEPLYYTNVFVTFGSYRRKRPHKLDRCIRYITLEHFLRKYRFNYGSVIYVQECSLLADNMDYNDKLRNAEMSLFNKLIAHETRGGALYYDTQSPLDSHYSIKRVSSTYFFIHKKINLFFFLILYVREMINTENGVNNFVDDVEVTTRKVLVPRWWFYRYNRYEYSYLTDDLDLNNTPYTKEERSLISFNKLYRELANKSLNKEGGVK